MTAERRIGDLMDRIARLESRVEQLALVVERLCELVAEKKRGPE